jgi:hypothetical protein
MSGKGFPQPEPIEQTSNLYLKGAPAQAISGLAPGARVNVAGSGTLQQYSHEKYGKKATHSATITLDKVRHTPAGKKAVRRAVAAIRASGKTAGEKAMEAARGTGKKSRAEKALERKRGVNPMTGD